jgi:DNA-binding ferritin-like protein
MAKTHRKRNMRATRKNRSSSPGLKGFQKEVTVVFLEMLLLVKLFHWKTYSYATHKATDELYESLNGHIDSFIEVLMGKSGSRIDLMNQKSIKLEDLQSTEKLKEKVNKFKGYLVGFENKPALKTMSNTDLFNIRDEILGDLNKFLYLLTLK